MDRIEAADFARASVANDRAQSVDRDRQLAHRVTHHRFHLGFRLLVAVYEPLGATDILLREAAGRAPSDVDGAEAHHPLEVPALLREAKNGLCTRDVRGARVGQRTVERRLGRAMHDVRDTLAQCRHVCRIEAKRRAKPYVARERSDPWWEHDGTRPCGATREYDNRRVTRARKARDQLRA